MPFILIRMDISSSWAAKIEFCDFLNHIPIDQIFSPSFKVLRFIVKLSFHCILYTLLHFVFEILNQIGLTDATLAEIQTQGKICIEQLSNGNCIKNQYLLKIPWLQAMDSQCSIAFSASSSTFNFHEKKNNEWMNTIKTGEFFVHWFGNVKNKYWKKFKAICNFFIRKNEFRLLQRSYWVFVYVYKRILLIKSAYSKARMFLCFKVKLSLRSDEAK